MKAIVARAYGPPESFALEDWPIADPGPGEVRVRLRNAGVSFVDVLVAAGRHQHKPSLPFVPGSEFSGEVLGVGEGVTHVAPGDRVCGGNQGGILAEEVTLPATRVQKLPWNASMEQAAILRASYLTAWYALVASGRVAAGETVLVLGAAGAVGIAAIEVARHFGATVIASASSAAKRDLARAHGAHHLLDSTAGDWRAQVKAIAGPRGLDIVVDPVGGTMTEPAFRSLGYRGRHLVIGFAAGEIPKLPVNLPLLKGASLVGVLASYFAEREPEAERAARARILELLAAGVFRPPVGRVYPWRDYVAAMQAVASGEAVGRIVLSFD